MFYIILVIHLLLNMTKKFYLKILYIYKKNYYQSLVFYTILNIIYTLSFPWSVL